MQDKVVSHEVWVEERNETMVFVTNNLKLAASTIAAIYKERWKIELFFKALKQSLKIKTFVGTSENAVQIQIRTALIAMLILKFLKLRSTFDWSLSNLIALLRQQLFVRRRDRLCAHRQSRLPWHGGICAPDGR